MGEILATSADNPDSGKQASIRLEGSDTWYPALVPMHAPRGSRTPSKAFVPVVGCLVNNTLHSEKNRFVLSWADMRCRPVSTNALFPAECDGANQRNVSIEDIAAAISFIESLQQEERRRELDLADIDNTFIKGKKTAIMVLISPSDATTAGEPWSYIAADHGSPNAYVDAVVRRFTAPVTSCARNHRPSPPLTNSRAPADGDIQLDVVQLVVGRGRVRLDHSWPVQGWDIITLPSPSPYPLSLSPTAAQDQL